MVTEEDDAFEQELRAAPWAYGQKRPETVEEIIFFLRQRGFDREANIILREFAILKARR